MESKSVLKELKKSDLDIFNKRLTVKLNDIPCDKPARSMIKYVKDHAGYYSCDRCIRMQACTSRRKCK